MSSEKAPIMGVRVTAAEYDEAMSLAYARHVRHFLDIVAPPTDGDLWFGPGLVTDLCECGLDRGEHWDGVGGTGQGCGKFVAR